MERQNIKTMSERKSKSIFIIVYVLFVIFLLSMTSCGSSRLTQQQLEIDRELDLLWIEYRYKSDSLLNEFYKK
jgi:flagellar basal body-associated protein FliL